MRIYAAKDYKDMSRKAANLISAQVILKPDAVLGLATGSTPVGAYEQLRAWYEQGDLDFSAVHSVNLDEYKGLSGEHDQSYRYFMNHNLFDHVNIDKENTNVPNGLARDPEAECARYDGLIRELGGIDLQLLGIGGNGHIGFNEPGEVPTRRSSDLYDSCLGPVTPAVQASVLQLHGDAVIIADEAALGMIREKTGWTGEVYDC